MGASYRFAECFVHVCPDHSGPRPFQFTVCGLSGDTEDDYLRIVGPKRLETRCARIGRKKSNFQTQLGPAAYTPTAGVQTTIVSTSDSTHISIGCLPSRTAAHTGSASVIGVESFWDIMVIRVTTYTFGVKVTERVAQGRQNPCTIADPVAPIQNGWNGLLIRIALSGFTLPVLL